MQNGKKKVLALLLAGCCVLSACGTKTDDTKTAEKGNFVTGTVECKEVYVRAKIPGYLTDIPVEEGQEVKQTQASATAKAAAGQVEAAKNAAEAAAAVVEKANANVKLLETEYAKYQELYAMDAVSQDNMDKLTTQLEAARLDAAAAAAQQQAAQGQYEAANGQLAAAKGVLDEVNLNLGQTSQYAPCNGTITMIASSLGERIGTGTTIITLTDYSDRWVMANVDEYAVGKLKVGQQIPLTSKAHPDTVFHGKIVNISKSPDFATKKSTNELNDQDVVTYEVKIALSEKDDIMLYPGMLVQVDLDKAGEKK